MRSSICIKECKCICMPPERCKSPENFANGLLQPQRARSQAQNPSPKKARIPAARNPVPNELLTSRAPLLLLLEACAEGEDEELPPLLPPVELDPPLVAVGVDDIVMELDDAAIAGSMLPQGMLMQAFWA